jgi:hypothetical protein
MRRLHILFALCVLLAVIRCTPEPEPPIPPQYTSTAISGRVIDSVSKQPLANVVVLAVWRTVSTQRGSNDGTFVITETRTDAEGRYVVDRWGPRRINYAQTLDRDDPELWLLHDGHHLGYFDEQGSLDSRAWSSSVSDTLTGPGQHVIGGDPARARPLVAGSRWNGQTLTMQPTGSSADVVRTLAHANPFYIYDPAPRHLELFWQEWLKMYCGLPPETRDSMTQPRSLRTFLVGEQRQSQPCPR